MAIPLLRLYQFKKLSRAALILAALRYAAFPLTAPKFTPEKIKKNIDNKRKIRYTKYRIERR